MSEEEEYEVESILRAKVVKKGVRKIWHYHVKWKGYDQDANTWEPFESFEGSEHLIEGFWERIGGNRDYRRLDLFKVGEEVFPVGPPGKIKGRKSAVQDKSKSPLRPQPPKRKPTDSEGEVQSLINEDVQEVVTRPVSTRKRRTSNVDEAAEAPSPKRRRARGAVEIADTDEEDESISKAPTSTRRTRPSASTSSVTKPSTSGRVSRAATSPAKPAPKAQSASQDRRKAPRRKPVEPEVIEIDTTDSEEEAVPETSRSNLADESGNATPMEEPVDKPKGKTNGAAKPLSRKLRTLAKPPADAPVKTNRTPRAVKSQSMTKQDGDAAQGPPTPNSTASPTAPRPKIPGSRAGPGRSSKGILDAVVQPPRPNITPRPQRTQTATPAARPAPGRTPRRMTPRPRGDSVDSMAVDEYLPPLTTEDLDRLASLSQPNAVPSTSAPAPGPEPAATALEQDVTSERDADGEVDNDFVEGATADEAVLDPQDAKTDSPDAVAEDQVMGEPEAHEESPKEPEPVVPPAPKEPLINPIDEPLGNCASKRPSSGFASWSKFTTIFDKPVLGTADQSPATPTAAQAETTTPVLLVPVTPSVRIPVVLEEIQPSSESSRKRLDEIAAVVQTTTQGAPGKFYKGQPVESLMKAFACGGSSARVHLQGGADAGVKEHFERFQSKLKDGSVFVAVFGSYVLVFCASTNSEFTAKLGISPNLAAASENVLVSEVLIADDSAYVEAIMGAEDEF